MSNVQRLAAMGWGGTNCSAPLKQLADARANVDTVIMISDNESWIDVRRHSASETLQQWQRIRKINPQARLICIDMQPHGTTQAPDRSDILNVGGFSDAMFDVISQFTEGAYDARHWVEIIEKINLCKGSSHYRES
jgi:60 kDa SS-A/Ro ribonucleoprotein